MSQETEFDRWWRASKYCQVVSCDDNKRQIALDGWNAYNDRMGMDKFNRILHETEQERETYRNNWIRAERAVGELKVSLGQLLCRCEREGLENEYMQEARVLLGISK